MVQPQHWLLEALVLDVVHSRKVVNNAVDPCRTEWDQNKTFVASHLPMNTPYRDNNKLIAVTTSNHSHPEQLMTDDELTKCPTHSLFTLHKFGFVTRSNDWGTTSSCFLQSAHN
ncbi:hypothetical protein QC760_009980 [Botrytis cinerea]